MGITLHGSIPILFAIGKVLSILAVLVTLAAVWNAWRRESFPEISYGRVTLSQKRLRVVWILVLIGAFGFGINEDPVAVSTSTMEDPELLEGGGPSRMVSTNLPLPFYRFERERVYLEGELASEETTEGFVLPWSLLWALVAYFVLVLRWDPDRPLARRILQGKKWRMEEDSPAGDTGNPSEAP